MKLFVINNLAPYSAMVIYFVEHDNEEDVRAVVKHRGYSLEGTATEYEWSGEPARLATLIDVCDLHDDLKPNDLFHALSTKVLQEVLSAEYKWISKMPESHNRHAVEHYLRVLTAALAQREGK